MLNGFRASLARLFTREAVGPSGPTYIDMPMGRGTYVPNWFQLDHRTYRNDPMRSSVSYACIAIIAQEMARLPVHVWTRTGAGQPRQRLHPHYDRLLRRPNYYMTRSDFMLFVFWALLSNGNAYWFRETQNGEDVAWHPINPNMVHPFVNEADGAIFYRVSKAPLTELDNDELVPQRNMAHMRLFTTRHPLIGVTPIQAASVSLSQNEMIKANSANFFRNMARPSGILKAPETITLTEEVANSIKKRFMDSSSAEAMGAPVVIGGGYEWQSMTMSATDAELVAQHRMTVEDIARVFRVPLHMLGDLQDASLNNVDALQRSFISQTLSFYVEHLEAQLDVFLGLGPNEYVKFDIEAAMLRPDLPARMEALAKGVQGGILAPNEAREGEDLPAVDGGDTVFLQQQMAPVNADRREDAQADDTVATLNAALRRHLRETRVA